MGQSNVNTSACQILINASQIHSPCYCICAGRIRLSGDAAIEWYSILTAFLRSSHLGETPRYECVCTVTDGLREEEGVVQWVDWVF